MRARAERTLTNGGRLPGVSVSRDEMVFIEIKSNYAQEPAAVTGTALLRSAFQKYCRISFSSFEELVDRLEKVDCDKDWKTDFIATVLPYNMPRELEYQ